MGSLRRRCVLVAAGLAARVRRRTRPGAAGEGPGQGSAELARQLDRAVAAVRAASARESLLRDVLALRGQHRTSPACPGLAGGPCTCGLDDALTATDPRVAARPWANAHGLVLVAKLRPAPSPGPGVARAAAAAERLTRHLAEIERLAARGAGG